MDLSPLLISSGNLAEESNGVQYEFFSGVNIENKCDELINKIVLLDEKGSSGGKRHYRLNDVITHGGHYWEESTKFILNCHHYKDSILQNYIKRCPDNNLKYVNKNHIELLSEIIKNKIKDNSFVIPDKNELVIHLRLGDHVEITDSFLQNNYVKIIKDACINNNNINKITFCTAFHYGNNITQGIWLYTDEKHKQNIYGLKKLFTEILENINIPIDIKSSKHPDEDFVYMIMAEHFIKDVGGFSNLVQKIRDYHRSLKSPDISDYVKQRKKTILSMVFK